MNYSWAGPKDTAAHTTRVSAGVVQTRRSLGWLPPLQQRLTKGAHVTERQVGEEERMAA